MSTAAPSPAARATMLRGDVVRLLRAALSPDGRTLARDVVAVVLAPAVIAPELPAGCAWQTAGEAPGAVRVAAVPFTRACELARARGGVEAVHQLAAHPPPRCSWCLYLEPGASCVVSAFPALPAAKVGAS